MSKFGTVCLSLKIAFSSETPCIIKSYVKDKFALMNTYLKKIMQKKCHTGTMQIKSCAVGLVKNKPQLPNIDRCVQHMDVKGALSSYSVTL